MQLCPRKICFTSRISYNQAELEFDWDQEKVEITSCGPHKQNVLYYTQMGMHNGETELNFVVSAANDAR